MEHTMRRVDSRFRGGYSLDVIINEMRYTNLRFTYLLTYRVGARGQTTTTATTTTTTITTATTITSAAVMTTTTSDYR